MSLWRPLDKDEGFAKGEVVRGGALAPLFCPSARELLWEVMLNSRAASLLGGRSNRSTRQQGQDVGMHGLLYDLPSGILVSGVRSKHALANACQFECGKPSGSVPFKSMRFPTRSNVYIGNFTPR